MEDTQAGKPSFQPQPLFLIALAFLLGILIADLLPPDLRIPIAGILIAVIVFTVPHFSKRFAPSAPVPALPYTFISLLLIALSLGILRHQGAQPAIDPAHIAYYNETPERLVITGVVIAPPDARDSYIQLEVRAERFHPDESGTFTGVSGQLLARVPTDSVVRYGDRVLLTGALQTPPEDELFSYREYLARAGIHSYLPFAQISILESGQANPALAAIYALRFTALERVQRLWPDPEASLLAGILLGIESGIPRDVKDAFNDTGTTHIIAISGFNMTIIAGLVAGAFSRWLGPRRGAVAAVFAVGGYTLLVGADAAVVRAALMGGLGLFARQVGRRQDGLLSLTLVAALMAVANPFVLWDVGFQLSFAATLGLILYAEPFSAWFSRLLERWLDPQANRRITDLAGEYLLFTIAANLTTLPLILYHFQRLALLSLPANLLILPVQPAVMLGAGAALLISLLWFPLGQLAAWLVWPFAAYTIRIVEVFAVLPGAARSLGEIPLWGVILFYMLLFAFPLYKDRIRFRPAIAVGALLVAAALIWNAVSHAPDGRLHITLLDVGAADSLLIETPDGRYVLINGGPSASTLSDALGRRLPLVNRQLDWLLVASPAEEQLAALPALIPRYPPDNVLWAGNIQASRASRFLLSELADAGIGVVYAKAGQSLDLGGGARLDILTVSPRGASLALIWDDFELLLPLGVSFDDLDVLAGRSPNILLLPDQGYAPLNPPEWLSGLAAQLVWLSVDAGNRQGLPDLETLQALGNTPLWRTDLNGWIEVITDGEQLWINSQR
jgi:competence protein ComEC